MTIDELVRENDLATKAMLPVDKTLVLFGEDTSPFLHSIRRKANALGIKCSMGVSQLYADLLPNAKYVDGIGKLTVSILLNRFVKNCHRKELS